MTAAPPVPAMTPLAGKIARLIETAGPISVADYFSMCLADPEYGYYLTREPFGVDGDFITAPEVTQLFGEIVGIFLVHAWQAQGRPEAARLVELGPGRGTLMADVLRTLRQLAPSLFETAEVHLVETSPRLAERQRRTLSGTGARCHWHAEFTEVPDGYTLLVANELFDALPIRQFVKTDGVFRERVVGLDGFGRLAFGLGPAALEPAHLPDGGGEDGSVFEFSPVREGVMRKIAERLVRCGGAALLIDYGHVVSGFGDTLQALRRQNFDGVLEHPGEADLTSHVDFAALVQAVHEVGGHIAGLAPQGDFLVGLGLLERAGRLGADKSVLEQTAIRAAVERIAGAGAGRMGELFKVLAVTGDGAPLAPFSQPAGRP